MTEITAHPFSFSKKEHLCSKRIIDTLFDGGSKSFSAYPLRAVFRPLPTECDECLVSVLISVSKKHFKRAVHRNRVKRQVRESYRKNKHLLYDMLKCTPQAPRHLALAFLWQADDLKNTAAIEVKMQNLLQRISESIAKQYEQHETIVESTE